MGKIAHVSHNTKHNHNTHNNQNKQPVLYSPVAMPISLHGQGNVAPKSSPRCSPTTVRRSGAVRLALINVDSLVLSAEIPPMKKEREGQGPGLRWLPLNGSTQQPTKGWQTLKGKRWGRQHAGLLQRGETFSHCLGGRIEQPKNENRESDGALGLGGRHRMAGHNNQPNVGISGRGDIGEGT
jgi:hypothetical protein